MRARQQFLPLVPLVRAYADAGILPVEGLAAVPVLGPRFRAILAAPTGLLREAFVDGASETEFRDAVVAFYRDCVQPPLQLAALKRRTGLVRHALGHLLRSRDPLAPKVDRFLSVQGAYHVPGLGPAFWSALCQALDPRHHLGWTPAIILGLRRLGLARWAGDHGPGPMYAALLDACARVRAVEPQLTALHVDHFLYLVAAMRGRALLSVSPGSGPDLPAVIRRERARLPLRRRLKERGRDLHTARTCRPSSAANGRGSPCVAVSKNAAATCTPLGRKWRRVWRQRTGRASAPPWPWRASWGTIMPGLSGHGTARP
jgi:hypothetical protein